MASLNEILLRDLAHNGDLVKTAGGDLATQEGLANLQDALLDRLVTEPGSLVHRPEYGVGIKRYQNKLNRIANQRSLALAIDANFQRDPRVEKVLGVLVEYDDLNPSLTKIKVRVKSIGLEAVVMEFVPFNEA